MSCELGKICFLRAIFLTKVADSRLPAYMMEGEIVSTIRENQITVIAGDTGCGKVRTKELFNFMQAFYLSHFILPFVLVYRRPKYLSLS